MEKTDSRADDYRRRASELRSDSAHWPEGRARRIMKQVATDYERLADQLERRRNRNPARQH